MLQLIIWHQARRLDRHPHAGVMRAGKISGDEKGGVMGGFSFDRRSDQSADPRGDGDSGYFERRRRLVVHVSLNT